MTNTVGPQEFDIGGVYTLVLVKGSTGYYGHYTSHQTNTTYSFDGKGMTRKQILKRFWDRAKKVRPGISNKRIGIGVN